MCDRVKCDKLCVVMPTLRRKMKKKIKFKEKIKNKNLKKTNRNTSKIKAKIGRFTRQLLHAFFSCFPWRLPFNQTVFVFVLI